MHSICIIMSLYLSVTTWSSTGSAACFAAIRVFLAWAHLQFYKAYKGFPKLRSTSLLRKGSSVPLYRYPLFQLSADVKWNESIGELAFLRRPSHSPAPALTSLSVLSSPEKKTLKDSSKERSLYCSVSAARISWAHPSLSSRKQATAYGLWGGADAGTLCNQGYGCPGGGYCGTVSFPG